MVGGEQKRTEESNDHKGNQYFRDEQTITCTCSEKTPMNGGCLEVLGCIYCSIQVLHLARGVYNSVTSDK